ncbi:MAG TPA: aminotransferase class III-fold pyridoxal phosphate-dependent enzyme, partial [Anaerolineae bacterium]|nr:aminotransferase class III-fold pyridoxal phosphate-dependent enzyme [Anaerolineae bacterium]
EENLLEKARTVGDHALRRMRQMMDRHPLIGDARGLGLMLGLELVLDRQTRERATAVAEQIMYCALRKGLSFKLLMGNIIGLFPPLTITIEQVDEALDIIEDCIKETEK